VPVPLAPGHDYTVDGTGWFYAARDGALTGHGKVEPASAMARAPAFATSKMRVVWDGPGGGTLSVYVDGRVQNGGPCFVGIHGAVAPAVGLVGADVAVSITGFWRQGSDVLAAHLAALPRFDMDASRCAPAVVVALR